MTRYFSILTIVVGLFSASQGLADGPIRLLPIFNAPGFTGQQTSTIPDKVLEKIGMTEAGSTIRVALYILEDRSLAEALVLASERGVDVQLVLDGRNKMTESGNAVDVLLNGFDGHPGIRCADEPCVKFCRGPVSLKIKGKFFGGSCHGLVINHNKFYLFSKLTDGTHDVVLQTSANSGDGQVSRYNDLLEIQNDGKLYEGYMHYWAGLKRSNTKITALPDFTGESGIRAHIFPRLISGGDPVLNLLKRASCQIPGSSIRVAQSTFTRAAVARRLGELAHEGCDVKVLTIDDPRLKSPSAAVREALGSDLTVMIYRGKNGEKLVPNSIHTKLVLIDASLDGSSEKRPTVLTGSHNLDLFSLKTNDEILLEIHDRSTLESYLDFWAHIVQDAKALPTSM